MDWKQFADQVGTDLAEEMKPVLLALKADMISRIEAVRSEIEPIRQREKRMADKLERIEQIIASATRKAA